MTIYSKERNTMRILKSHLLLVIILALSIQLFGANKKSDDIAIDADINLGNGMKISKIIHPLEDFDPKVPVKPQIITKADIAGLDYRPVPLAGFSPYVVVMTSNKALGEFDWEHQPEYSYRGTPLRNDPNSNTMPYVIGILDSGADSDLIAGSSVDTLGINTSRWLTGNIVPIGGAGADTVDSTVSYPLGLFTAGLSALSSDNLTVDPNQIVGHSNASVLAAPAITCQGQETVSAAVGRPLMSAFTSIIRNDKRQKVTIGNRSWSGPDIQFASPYTTTIPEYTYEVGIALSSSFGIPPTTAAWSYSIDDLGTPAFPTILTAFAGSFIPTGGTFLVNIRVKHNNQDITLTMLLDTGAQSTIINSTTASNLNLPITGEFLVEVCGVAGSTENIAGYYLDKVEINARSDTEQPIKFGNVPVIVMDIGTGFDGVLGMNFFYDRNITFKPSLSTASAKLYVSDPVDYAYVDFNDSGRVDLVDFALFSDSWLAQFGQEDYTIEHDLFLSDSIGIDDLQVFVDNWLKDN